MAPARPSRRSERGKQPTSIDYTANPFAGLEDFVSGTSDSESDTAIPDEVERDVAFDDDDDDDDDLIETEEEDEEEVVETEEEEEEVVANSKHDLLSEDAVTDDSEEEDEEEYTDEDDQEYAADGVRIRTSRPRRGFESSDVRNLPAFNEHGAKVGFHSVTRHSRGVTETRLSGKGQRSLMVVGPGREDVLAFARTRDRWVNAPGLPRSKEDSAGRGGLRLSFYYPLEKMKREAGQGWEWYYELGGQDLFKNSQKAETISKVQRPQFVTGDCYQMNRTLLGSVNKPTLYELRPQQAISLASAFPIPPAKAPKRRGWLLNIGAKVPCMEWVPNQKGSQYLAIAVRMNDDAEKVRAPSACLPRDPAQSCIQIFEFQSSNSTGSSGKASRSLGPPKLRAVLSFDWNDVRRLKWCPTPDREREAGKSPKELRLGLLAGIWMDGYVRILEIVLPASEATTYLHISGAAFAVKPPDTICTAVTWLSTMSIAIGCANGHVAIYNLPEALGINTRSESPSQPPPPPPPNPRPWFYKPLHQTYILHMTSGYPSRPVYLFTNSIDGETRMTDLRHPTADFALAPRSRVAQGPLAWHDHAQTLLCTGENFQLRCLSLRQFHMSTALDRYDSLLSAVAVSPLHPVLLVACADGSARALNVARKARGGRRTLSHSHTWFAYEWRRPLPAPLRACIRPSGGAGSNHRPPRSSKQRSSVEAASTKASAPAPAPAAMLDVPLGRFSEGYKAKAIQLDEGSKTNFKDGIPFATVFPEEQCVTHVCWNPNLRWGTWAAAVVGSGVVRVQDLAIDRG
jgi:transcription factor C subunit 6